MASTQLAKGDGESKASMEALLSGGEIGEMEPTFYDGDLAIDVIRSQSFRMRPRRDAGKEKAATPEDIPEEKADAPAADDKLGTIKGVYLPCTQNILGVILFLRLPYITAQAGTLLTTVIVTLCVISTLLTSLSLSAVATNGQIAEGGPYYIISRNLGAELGGAIGILFYLGTAIAGTMYVLGGIEAIQISFLKDEDDSTYSEGFTFETQLFALALCAVMNLVVYGGVGIVNRSAFFFLAIVILSIVLLLIGVVLFAADVEDGELSDEDRVVGDNMGAAFEEDPDTGLTPSFFSLIALFYPSVTGIMAGSNRSGVLQSPAKSIPSGTIGAILTTYGIYLTTVWMFGLFISNEALKADKLIVAAVAWPVKYCVQAGIVLSCVGAGLQSLTGAPRLLAAIAEDNIIPFLEPFKAAPGTNPVKAVVLTWAVSSLPCLAGNLDFITPFITMFFLLMYASINCACFVQAYMRAPGWRPTFQYFHWSTALFGALWCVTLMFIVSWYIALVVAFLALLLLLYIKTQNAERNWGDALRGLRFNLARDQLLSLDTRAEFHAKNWRPQILLITDTDDFGNPLRSDILSLASQLKKGRGLLMVYAFIHGDLRDDGEKATRASEYLRVHLRREGVNGFARVVLADDVARACFATIQAAGIGTMRPNCVMVHWPEDVRSMPQAQRHKYVDTLKSCIAVRKTLLVLKGGATLPENDAPLPGGNIDVWWIVHNGGVLLLIPYLLTLHKVWRNCKLRLFTVVTSADADALEVERRTRDFIERVRIPAEVIPIVFGDEATFVYAQTTKGGPLSHTAAKAKILDKLNLPNTMSVAVRGPKRESRPPPPLASLFKVPEDVESQEGNPMSPPSPPKGREMDAALMSPEVRSRVRSASDDWELDQRRARMAVFMNRQLKQYSSDAQLIVTNLPLKRADDPSEFLGYVEAMAEGVDNVLLVRGSGKEVVTAYG